MTLDFSRLWRPTDKPISKPSTAASGGMSECALVPNACRRGRKDGGLAQILQRGPPAWRDRAQGADLITQSRWRHQPAIVTRPGNSTFRRSREWDQSTSGPGSNRRWMTVQCQVTIHKLVWPTTALLLVLGFRASRRADLTRLYLSSLRATGTANLW